MESRCLPLIMEFPNILAQLFVVSRWCVTYKNLRHGQRSRSKWTHKLFTYFAHGHCYSKCFCNAHNIVMYDGITNYFLQMSTHHYDVCNLLLVCEKVWCIRTVWNDNAWYLPFLKFWQSTVFIWQSLCCIYIMFVTVAHFQYSF